MNKFYEEKPPDDDSVEEPAVLYESEKKTASLTEERKRELEALIELLGLFPTDSLYEHLNQAFIHRSYRTEAGLDEDNERLEFLGDSVIGLAATEYLLKLYPNSTEGWLSKLRASVVSRAVLGEVGKRLGIGDLVLLGAGEDKSGGRLRISILGSTLEAVCGLLYLHYEWGQIRTPILDHVVIPALELVRRNHLVDYKSQLQEWTQREYQEIPDYEVVQEGGPDHSKTFEVEVRLRGEVLGQGHGRRKKSAENEAARQALTHLQGFDPSGIE